MRATEAGSLRASGHRIGICLLSEYQMFPILTLVLCPVPPYTLAREYFIYAWLESPVYRERPAGFDA